MDRVMINDLLTISVTEMGHACRAGMAYLSQKYKTRLGVSPSQPDYLLVGRVGDSVAVTIGINVPKSGVLAIAERHGLSDQFGQDTVEFCRWCADSPQFASRIALAAIQHGRYLRATTALVEQRPAVCRRSTQLGVTLTPVEGAALDYSKIDHRHLPFYTESPPSLYRLDLRLAEMALTIHIQKKY